MTIIPADQYNAHPGISKSAICAARIDTDTVSMLHMRAEMIRERGDAGTPAMQRGTLAHAALLEPGALLSRCAVWEGESKRGKEWSAFKEANEGRLIVDQSDLDRIADMSRALRMDPLARDIVGRIEHAERGAIYAAARQGTQTDNASLYCPWFACTDCVRAIIEAGIREVVGLVAVRQATPARWEQEIAMAEAMLREAGVGIRWLNERVGVTILFDGKEIDL